MSKLRTKEKFEEHLRLKVNKCRQFWLILYRDTALGKELFALPQRCGSNYCDYCRVGNILVLRKKLYASMKYHRWRLVTLTYPRKGNDFITLIKNLGKEFNRFMASVRKKYKNIAYARAVELHEDDYPHVHLVVNRYVPIDFLIKR